MNAQTRLTIPAAIAGVEGPRVQTNVKLSPEARRMLSPRPEEKLPQSEVIEELIREEYGTR